MCHCAGSLQEDLAFRAEMALYSLPQRRFVCACGHAQIVAAPIVTASGHIEGTVPRRYRSKTCACGTVFETRYNATWCSDACRAAQAKEAERRRRGRMRVRRAERPVRRQPDIVIRRPYTPRPTVPIPSGLSTAWV